VLLVLAGGMAFTWLVVAIIQRCLGHQRPPFRLMVAAAVLAAAPFAIPFF
jgi:hypothetical protein